MHDTPRSGEEQLREAIVEQALCVCRGVPAWNGHDPRCLHTRGLMAARNGDDDLAFACLVGAVRQDPLNADYLSDLGRVLLRKGRPRQAIAAQLRAITIAPEHMAPYLELGRALFRAGHLGEAVVAFKEALQRDVRGACTFGELADVFRALGHHEEALRVLEDLPQLKRNEPETYLRLGRVHMARQEWNLALAAFRQGLAIAESISEPSAAQSARSVSSANTQDDLWAFRSSEAYLDDRSERPRRSRSDTVDDDPRLTALYVGIGDALFQLRAFDEAVGTYLDALNRAPRDLPAAKGLVLALEALGHGDEAVGAWVSLGGALEAHHRFDEAIVAYRQALLHKPDCLRALIQLGRSQATCGKFTDAVQSLDRALALEPDSGLAHTELGRVRSLLGDAHSGWREFAWWCSPLRLQKRAFEQPVWNGAPLDGGTLLVWADQELGDTIQWIRYVPVLKRIATRVVVECQARLVPLVRTVPGIDLVVAQQAPLPAFDIHVPLTLLPIVSQMCRSTPCQVPYFRADPTLVDVWRQRLEDSDSGGSALTVGLCWAGHPDGINGAFRFAPLSAFAPLGRLGDVRFISLQIGPQAAELLGTPAGLHVGHLQDESGSTADTAALMASLDLVITVDTMVAHLAGALGRPVWLVLPHVADWRWLTDREDTPLYPTMRLFRQEKPRDWTGLFVRVRKALASRIRSRQNPPGLNSHPDSLGSSRARC